MFGFLFDVYVCLDHFVFILFKFPPSFLLLQEILSFMHVNLIFLFFSYFQLELLWLYLFLSFENFLSCILNIWANPCWQLRKFRDIWQSRKSIRWAKFMELYKIFILGVVAIFGLLYHLFDNALTELLKPMLMNMGRNCHLLVAF